MTEGRVWIRMWSVQHESQTSSSTVLPVVVMGTPQPANTVRHPPSQPSPPDWISALQSPRLPHGFGPGPLHGTATWGHSGQHQLEWSRTLRTQTAHSVCVCVCVCVYVGGDPHLEGLWLGRQLGCWLARVSAICFSPPGRSEPFSATCREYQGHLSP